MEEANELGGIEIVRVRIPNCGLEGWGHLVLDYFVDGPELL